MIKLMMIVNQPDIAAHVESCGVDRIFVDLEYMGKKERQGHLDTWASRHTPEDISKVRKALRSASLLVRLNPWYEDSPKEIEDALSRGADLLMLPMFRSIDAVENFARAVKERVPIIPLAETHESLKILPQVIRTPGVSEVFIGLNDLHISLGQRFMFEPLTDGTLDLAAEQFHAAGMPFGFGGLARFGEGLLPAERILGEHVRLGSSSAILSRTFHRQAQTLTELKKEIDFSLEVKKLRKSFSEYQTSSPSRLRANQQEVKRIVNKISSRIDEKQENHL